MSSASMSHKAAHRGISIVVDGETILNLESKHLSGAPLTTENEAHIRWAIEALLGLLGLPALEAGQKASFQHRTDDWMLACFGPRAAYDIRERSHRFLEEALELVQAARLPGIRGIEAPAVRLPPAKGRGGPGDRRGDADARGTCNGCSSKYGGLRGGGARAGVAADRRDP